MGGSVVPQGGELDSCVPTDRAETERRDPSWLESGFTSASWCCLWMRGVLLPKPLGLRAWSSWGPFSILGLSCFCFCEISSLKSYSFFFLSLLLASRKSLAIFVHLAVAFLVLLIAWDSNIELQFLLGSVISSEFFLVFFQEPEGVLVVSAHSLPKKSLQVKTSFLFILLRWEEGRLSVSSLGLTAFCFQFWSCFVFEHTFLCCRR